MKRMYLLLAAVSLLFAQGPLSTPLLAQCGGIAKHVAYSFGDSSRSAHFQLAADTQASPEPIVGLWKLDFEDPADKYSDKGYAVWHSDHTELMNSTRPPSVGAICQGVWERVGPSTYALNHFAMGYGDGVNLTDVYQFRELITVDASGNSYAGLFVIGAFDPKTHAVRGIYKGTVTGVRITQNTTIDTQNF